MEIITQNYVREDIMLDLATTQIHPRRMPLVAFITANTISAVGNVFTSIAVPWFVLQTTGSATRAGITGAVTALSFIASFFGGTFVDRIGHKRVAVASDLGSGVIVALVPLLYHTVGLAFWQLLVLVFLRALLASPGNAARYGLRPGLIALADASKERANSIMEGVRNSALVVGTGIAGLLIALIGTSNMLWLDGGSFLISATLIWLAVPAGAGAMASASTKSRYWRDLAEGWRFFTGDRVLLAVTVAAIATNFAITAQTTVLLPVYARQVFGSAVSLGLLNGGFLAGTVVGTALYAVFAPHLPRRGTLIGGLFLSCIGIGLLVPLPPLPLAVAAMALQGLGLGPFNPIVASVDQERVPTALRGRVMGMIFALAMVANPVASLLAGLLVGRFGLAIGITAIAAITFGWTGWVATNPSLRRMSMPKDV